MTRLLLVGASGLAHEAANVARAIHGDVEIRILDDDSSTWGSHRGGAPVVGGVEAVSEYPEHQVVVCVGRGAVRRTLVDRLRRLEVGPERFVTLVHPGVRMPEDCTVGAGSILMQGVVLTGGVTLGEHVVVMPNVTLTHGTAVREHATLCAGVALGGDVQVGSGAYVGMNSCIRERVRVGHDAVLGMGSVLLVDLPEHECWAGSPARPLEHRMEVAR